MKPKEREKIYRKIAKRIANDIGFPFAVCLELQSEAVNHNQGYILQQSLHKHFPEFFMWNYVRGGGDVVWFDESENGNQQRILALLLSAEMTKTENLK